MRSSVDFWKRLISLRGELADEELGGLLETSDLSESDCAGSESMGFLDTVGGRLCLLGSSLVSDVLSWVLGAGVANMAKLQEMMAGMKGGAGGMPGMGGDLPDSDDDENEEVESKGPLNH